MTPKAVVDAIERLVGISGKPRQLRDAIEDVLLGAGLNAASAAELVYNLRSKVVTEISRRRDESDGSGEIAIVHLRGAGDEIVFGSSFIFENDSDQIKETKRNRLFAREIYASIKSLNFNQFEKFGRSVLRELGAGAAKVTPQAGDQGIDFYGDISVGSLVGADPAILRLMHETRVVMVGQAKHYPDRVIGPAIVRELVGALSLSRTYTYSNSNIDLLNDVRLRPFSPVLALLFTSGGLSKGARYLAERAGLIAFSGWQLAVFLADRGVGLVDDCGAVKFDHAALERWLA